MAQEPGQAGVLPPTVGESCAYEAHGAEASRQTVPRRPLNTPPPAAAAVPIDRPAPDSTVRAIGGLEQLDPIAERVIHIDTVVALERLVARDR